MSPQQIIGYFLLSFISLSSTICLAMQPNALNNIELNEIKNLYPAILNDNDNEIEIPITDENLRLLVDDISDKNSDFEKVVTTVGKKNIIKSTHVYFKEKYRASACLLSCSVVVIAITIVAISLYLWSLEFCKGSSPLPEWAYPDLTPSNNVTYMVQHCTGKVFRI